MLVNKEEIRKLMKQGKLSNQEDLNTIFRSMIKDAIETIYEGELTEMLGYEKYERKGKKGEEKENNARKHRLINPGKIPLEIIEIQVGEYIEENDIVRFEDRYSRVD